MNTYDDNEYPDETRQVPALKRMIRSRAVYISASVIVVVVITALIAIPYIIRSKLVDSLEKAGMTGVKVADVDLNPFSRRLAVEGFAFTSPDGFSVDGELFEVRFRILPLVKRHISIRGVTLAGINAEIDSVVMKGRERPEKTEKPERAASGRGKGKWAAGVDTFSITRSSVGYRTADGVAVVMIDDISLAGYKGWDPEHAVSVRIRLGFDDGVAGLQATGTPLSAAPVLRAAVELSDLPLSWAAPLLTEAGLSLDGTLTAELSLDASTKPGAGVMDISHKGTVAIEGLVAEHTGRRITMGRAAVEATVDAIHPLPTGQGRPVINSATASVTLGRDGGKSGVSLVSTADKLEVLGADEIKVSGISMDASRKTDVKSVRAKGLRIGGPIAPDDKRAALLALNQLVVSGFELVPGELVRIASIEIEEPKAVVERDSKGRTALIDTTASAAGSGKKSREPATKEKAPEPADPSARPAKAARVVVDSIEMKGRGSVDFTDNSVKPVFKTRLDLEKMSLKGIDTAPVGPKPKGAKVELKAGVGAYAKLDLEGTISLHESPPSMSLKGKITSMEMPPLSSYTQTALGYNLTSGQMDADLKAEVDKGEIDGHAGLLMRGLEVAPSAGGTAAEDLTTELNMPLGSALSLLRSSDGSIKLDIPVTGDLTSPKFSLAAVINKAVGGAMKKAAFSYLKYYFQPYGSLITVAQMVGKYAAAVRLDPIVFELGSVDIPPGATEYMAKVAGFMTERPGVSVRLCGFAVDDEPLADWWRLRSSKMKASGAELSKDADGLALWRAEAVKARLVSEYGIEDSRLLVCLPEVEQAPVPVEAEKGKAEEKPIGDGVDAQTTAPAVRPQPRVEVLI